MTELDKLLEGHCDIADCWICEAKRKGRAELAELRKKLAAYENTDYQRLTALASLQAERLDAQTDKIARLEAVADAARDVQKFLLNVYGVKEVNLDTALAALDNWNRTRL